MKILQYRHVFACGLLLQQSGVAYESGFLEKAKEAVRAYYEDGAYEQELARIVVMVKKRFSERALHPKQVVIFDVDDVALSSYQFFKEHDFGCVWSTWCAFLETEHLPPVAGIKMLYDHFRELGYKIVFLTGRKKHFYEVTERNLIAVGYTEFERLIVRDVAQEQVEGAVFKEQARKELVKEGYEIVCSIDDLAPNLEGAHVGYAVKIPNMLYS